MANPVAPVALAFVLLLAGPSLPYVIRQPESNVWVTLAKAMGNEQMCLHNNPIRDPLSSSLVGAPVRPEFFPETLVKTWQQANSLKTEGYVFVKPFSGFVAKLPIRNPLQLWHKWVDDLKISGHKMNSEPQEFQLIGSLKAFACVQFQFAPEDPYYRKMYQNLAQRDPNYIAHNWCSDLVTIRAHTSPEHWYEHPIGLPKGLFFICGDRAWAGIPSHFTGGPCTFGRITLASPNMTLLPVWSNNSAPKLNSRLLPNCSTDIYHWTKGKRIAVSIFLPWVAAAKALGEVGNLECWVQKQANLTSEAIADLLQDEQITRKATLQNRAAIDFLLLSHGHGCEQFEGLCCFNLSSRSRSVHQRLQDMGGLISKIQFESSRWFEETSSSLQQAINATVQAAGDWAHRLLRKFGLPEWGATLVKDCLIILLVILLIAFSLALFRRYVFHQLFSLINKKGGGVEVQPPMAAPIELQPTDDTAQDADLDLDSWDSDNPV